VEGAGAGVSGDEGAADNAAPKTQGVARVERSVAERRVDQTPRFTKRKSLPQALMLTSRRVTTMVPTKTNCQPQALIQLNSSRSARHRRLECGH